MDIDAGVELRNLLEGLKYNVFGSLDLVITGISYDSRKVKPGDIFVAISGMQLDGHDFIYQAVKNGASAVLGERQFPDLEFTQIIVKDSRHALGLISANFYDHPAKKLKVLGITGTNGKTTTTYLVKSILEHSGYRVGLIGTIQTLIGDRVLMSERTTPESLDLQYLLAQMVAEQIDFVVIEVSSHALELHRVTGISFAGALFTNLSQDHLNFHASMTDYFNVKAKLFEDQDCPAVVNIDDPWGERILALRSSKIISYAVNCPADFQGENIELENAGVSYILNSKLEQISIRLKLTGYFNVYNSLGAAALCATQQISLQHIKSGLEAITGVVGRFEQIENPVGLNVVVDYAHTPNGLENVLQSGRELTPQGRLILVFGAGGDRDVSKRALMGEVAAKLADVVIITSDNPRSEDPAIICSSIEKGLLLTKLQVNYEIIVDRRSAIRRALELANCNDLVIIAGKGHETYQEFARGRIHFDDREEVRKVIKELIV